MKLLELVEVDNSPGSSEEVMPIVELDVRVLAEVLLDVTRLLGAVLLDELVMLMNELLDALLDELMNELLEEESPLLTELLEEEAALLDGIVLLVDVLVGLLARRAGTRLDEVLNGSMAVLLLLLPVALELLLACMLDDVNAELERLLMLLAVEPLG